MHMSTHKVLEFTGGEQRQRTGWHDAVQATTDGSNLNDAFVKPCVERQVTELQAVGKLYTPRASSRHQLNDTLVGEGNGEGGVEYVHERVDVDAALALYSLQAT